MLAHFSRHKVDSRIYHIIIKGHLLLGHRSGEGGRGLSHILVPSAFLVKQMATFKKEYYWKKVCFQLRALWRTFQIFSLEDTEGPNQGEEWSVRVRCFVEDCPSQRSLEPSTKSSSEFPGQKRWCGLGFITKRKETHPLAWKWNSHLLCSCRTYWVGLKQNHMIVITDHSISFYIVIFKIAS